MTTIETTSLLDLELEALLTEPSTPYLLLMRGLPGSRVAAFDRWLAEHDRVIAERAWDEGFTRGFYAGQSYPDGADASEPDIDNPYCKEQENNNA